jgi:hypothetical protein
MTELKTVTQSIQDRLQGLNPEESAALDGYASHYCKLEAELVACHSAGKPANKKVAMQKHGVSGRQFNSAAAAVRGMFLSQRTNILRNYRVETKIKLTKVRQRLSDAQQRLRKAKRSGSRRRQSGHVRCGGSRGGVIALSQSSRSLR